jgi:hypothetical protein
MIIELVSVFQAFGRTNLFDSLTSTTFVEANQSFVLGESNHGDYSAKIINKGRFDVEVFTALENENEYRSACCSRTTKANIT